MYIVRTTDYKKILSIHILAERLKVNCVCVEGENKNFF